MTKLFRSLAFAFAVCCVLSDQSTAEVGNDNPTGITGEYNGSVTTGGSYDPYTGNAKRFVDDLSVTGSVGAYPLKWTRVLNTRTGPSGDFGQGGAWSHSYKWGLWVRPYDPNHHFEDPPDEGPDGGVSYPDGRTLILKATAANTYSEKDAGLEPLDRIEHMGGGNYDLVMQDGGRVRFEHPAGSTSGFDLKVTKIIDPYGQTTVLTRDTSGRLSRVTEPAGRYLQINYTTFSYIYSGHTYYVDVISSVQAFDGIGHLVETVSYIYTQTVVTTYTYFYLTQVNYDDGTHAYYTYCASNVGGSSMGLVQTCNDVRFAGPMSKIEYEYQPGTNPDVARGQIMREKNATTHQIVSEVVYPPYDPSGTLDPAIKHRRTETRGDGATRTFQYSWMGYGILDSYTDFKNQTSQIDYGGNPISGNLLKYLTDARGSTTTIEKEGGADKVIRLTHPDGTFQGFAYQYVNGVPYYLQIHGDELGRNTYYDRDAYHRVSKIWYPPYPASPYATEEFTYNTFGQVLTHLMTSGGTETFTYDGRGLKTSSYPPPTSSDPNPASHPTRYYYYTTGPQTDRLQYTVDPRGNATWYEYNGRGQITKVTHQDGTFTQNAYFADGTLAWTADENHPNAGLAGHENERTRYTYDEYKRVLTVTNLLGLTTTTSYALDSAWANPLLHTTNSAKFVQLPSGRSTVFDYDENFRKIDQVAALGTADVAWTFFQYDVVGNLTRTTDPRGNATNFGYDNRNRQTSVTNALNETTSMLYDAVNKVQETRPDGNFRGWDYDSMNRVWHAYDWGSDPNQTTHPTTTYTHNATDTVRTTIDAKGAVYTFQYDALNRKTSETYPLDALGAQRAETWHYDPAGNIDQDVSVSGNTNTLQYDNRNRLTRSTWAWGGQVTVTSYDPASRVTSIMTQEGATTVTTVAYGYDSANQQIWEDQTLAGYPTRRVETLRDNDGNRTNLNVPPNYQIFYDYNQRGELFHIRDGNNNSFATFTRDVGGNVTNRRLDWIYPNGANYSYDALSRPTTVDQGDATQVFQHNHYQYDNVGREVATWRDEDGNKGERFSYNATSQLTSAIYKADNVWTGSPSSWSKKRDYGYTPDLLNWTSMNENGSVTPFASNALNQYTSINGQVPQYDIHFNLYRLDGFTYDHDAPNRLISVTGNGHSAQFTYDGLGRCVRRTVDGETRLFTYDAWNPILEWDQAGNWMAWNVYGTKADEILARYHAWYGALIYKQDKQGNVVALLNGANQIVEKYTYDAYGTPTITNWDGTGGRASSNYGNRFMYTGREWISAVSLYDYRHRFYHPGIARFIETDPTGFDAGDMNLFRYCGNDPVDKTDPTGLVANIAADRIWKMACFFDSGNSFQDSYGEYMGYRPQAGMGDNAGGGESAVRFEKPDVRISTPDRAKLDSQEKPDDQHFGDHLGRDFDGPALTRGHAFVDDNATVRPVIDVQYAQSKIYGPQWKDKGLKSEPDHIRDLTNSMSSKSTYDAAVKAYRHGGISELRTTMQNLMSGAHILSKRWDTSGDHTLWLDRKNRVPLPYDQ